MSHDNSVAIYRCSPVLSYECPLMHAAFRFFHFLFCRVYAHFRPYEVVCDCARTRLSLGCYHKKQASNEQ